jgi:peptidoglycan/xylan/chitin deacetylase (PgdA/CDA1 family)
MFVSLLTAAVGCAHAEDVALTFDDLPIYGPRGSIEDAQATTHVLLRSLVRHHLPATGFVNEIQLDGTDRTQRTALLSDWLDAGMDLGNHSYSHLSLTHTPVEAYIADVARGETATSALLAQHGRRERWYRYPYLETGATTEARQQFEGWLSDHGYRIAPVTMENSDWQFADRYDEAVARQDRAATAEVQRAYLDYTARVVSWYRSAAFQLLGRHPAFVFLLHASRLNAASMDALAKILRRQRLHAVTLDEAMKDPAYVIADRYVGPDGDEWLTRWSMTLHKDLPWSTYPRVPAMFEKPAAH